MRKSVNNTTKQAKHKIRIRRTGMSVYITWDQLDQLADQWAKKTFGDHVHGETERDETDCYIAVNGLRNSDYEHFKAYYDKFDKDGIYEVKEEFATGALKSVFPETVTMGILNEELSSILGHAVSGMLAGYDGICFMEMNPHAYRTPPLPANKEAQERENPLLWGGNAVHRAGSDELRKRGVSYSLLSFGAGL